uniref:Uncharacterized protein n=1 Tax=uncultured marine virus TaxID=186617 RepID=A0A0F7KZV8_9VIRU|nr:hypothetical protein [uncultured marine virus]
MPWCCLTKGRRRSISTTWEGAHCARNGLSETSSSSAIAWTEWCLVRPSTRPQRLLPRKTPDPVVPGRSNSCMPLSALSTKMPQRSCSA